MSTLYADCEGTASTEAPTRSEESSEESSSTSSKEDLPTQTGPDESESSIETSTSIQETLPGTSSETEPEDTDTVSSRDEEQEPRVSTRTHTLTGESGEISRSMETIEFSSGPSDTGSSGELDRSSQDDNGEDDGDSQTGTYIGIGIGAVAGLIFLILAARLAYRWYRRETNDDKWVMGPIHSQPLIEAAYMRWVDAVTLWKAGPRLLVTMKVPIRQQSRLHLLLPRHLSL